MSELFSKREFSLLQAMPSSMGEPVAIRGGKPRLELAERLEKRGYLQSFGVLGKGSEFPLYRRTQRGDAAVAT